VFHGVVLHRRGSNSDGEIVPEGASDNQQQCDQEAMADESETTLCHHDLHWMTSHFM